MTHLELTREQIRLVTLNEIEFQLTIMKQYLTEEETHAYETILNRTSTLREYESIMDKHHEAWPLTTTNE